MSKDKRKISIWPNGEWCFTNEVTFHMYRTDDFQISEVPENWNPEDIDKHIKTKAINTSKGVSP